MFLKRFAVAAASALATLLFGLGAANFGLQLCSPTPLPGDWVWAQWQYAYQAIQLVFARPKSISDIYCFTGDPTGAALSSLSSQTLPIIAAIALFFVAWIVIGPSLHRLWIRKIGKHTIVAGEPDRIGEAAREARRRGMVVFVAINFDNLKRLRTRFWLSMVEPGYGSGGIKAALTRLGSRRARSVFAASSSDIANVEIVGTAIQLVELGEGAQCEIVALIEEPGLRNLQAHELVRRAAARGVDLTVLSLSQMQIRQGVKLAIPYEFRVAAASRVHVVVSGAGRLLQPLTMHLARQAYELGSERPILTVVHFGTADFSEAALQRFTAAKLAADVLTISGDSSDAAGFERAIGQVGFEEHPVWAVHCAGERDGEAEALARRWEIALRQFQHAVPPIVIYPSAASVKVAASNDIGESGMWRWCPPVEIGTARDLARMTDRHARAIHEDYLDKERKKLGLRFPTQRSHAAWSELPAEFQDDNRAVADHFDVKLSLISCRTASGADRPAAELSSNEIELLAALEHARWMANKSLDGWTYGTIRDDRRRLHPSMLPYDQLPEIEKQKDRDNVVAMPQQLRLANKRVVRDFACGVILAADSERPIQFDSVITRLRAWTEGNTTRHPVIWLALDDPRSVALAEALGRAGLSIGVVSTEASARTDDHAEDFGLAGRIARIMNLADRHRIFAKDDGLSAALGARDRLRELCDALVVEGNTHPGMLHQAVAIWDGEKGFINVGWLA